MDIALTPRKSPRQSRSAVTVAAILDATARILIERGYAGTSTLVVRNFFGDFKKFILRGNVIDLGKATSDERRACSGEI